MIVKTASDDTKYHKIPFLYLTASYLRNQAIKWADEKYVYKGKMSRGSWMVYKWQLRN